MANGFQKRTRSARVAALELPPGMIEQTLDYLQRRDVLLRLGLCALTAVVLWAISGGWAPPVGYRLGYTPQRNVVAKVEFKSRDLPGTKEAQDKAARTVRCVYELDREPLAQLRTELQHRVVLVTAATSLNEPDVLTAWREFFPQPPIATEPPTQEELEQFAKFHEALPDQDSLKQFETGTAQAMEPFEQRGLLRELAKEHRDGTASQKEIVVQHKGKSETQQKVKVSEVLIGRAEPLKKQLTANLGSPEVAQRAFEWLRPRLPETLQYRHDETQTAIAAAKAKVPEQFNHYKPGEMLAKGGEPLDPESLAKLELEHQAITAKMSIGERINHSLATFGMFVALSTLCGVYIVCYERKLLADLRRFATMLALVVITVGTCLLAAQTPWRAEVIPLLVFGMTVSIAYHQELALLLSTTLALVIVVAIGQGLSEFIVLTAAAATAVLLLGRIRSRRKLTYVGLAVGAVVFLTTFGVETLDQQPLRPTILQDAWGYGLFSVAAGLLMTALLPFIVSLFAVQTEFSLLELGDVAHPLLQELVRRAPGTYNHSINVASIGEAAAESIGAKGLLVRVGAYFHDIGKMLKPGYFVENQGQDANRHDTLMPAMSTLIIIAHIKDGADLARQHHLPQPIIDFILQHHGTTLVEYFFRRASEQKGANGGDVEESAFRYPGPKPQTREAAVLMLADAVESACRTLVEPTPARIESLVHDIAMKRLLDGQFDGSGITLQELAIIEDSLAKSLTAVYHGRVKYPEAERHRA